MKPIFRWTIGRPSKNGYECLEYAIKSFLKLYGDDFDYYIMYNNCDIQRLREIVARRPITLIAQTWEHSPVPVVESNKSPTLWKFCPARLDITRHEIVCDNDLIIVKMVKQISEFLNRNDCSILVEDPIKYQGKFCHLFDDGEKYNAGFVGLPPGFDLGRNMKSLWEKNGMPEFIGPADEQGLTTMAIKSEKFILVSQENFCMVHTNGATAFSHYDSKTNTNAIGFRDISFFQDNSDAYHFVGLNAKEQHNYWELFRRHRKQKLIL
jgi:hypothetical protein